MAKLHEIQPKEDSKINPLRRRLSNDGDVETGGPQPGRLRRQKTVTWKDVEPHHPNVTEVERRTSGPEATLVGGPGDYDYEVTKLEQTETTLSRFITYNASKGPLPKQLLDAIKQTRHRLTDISDPGFLPRDKLQEIMNNQVIKDVLINIDHSFRRRIKIWKKNPPRTIEQEVEMICADNLDDLASSPTPNTDTVKKPYRKILAILVLIERPGTIRKFIDEEVCDSALPLFESSGTSSSCNSFTLYRKDPDNGSEVEVKCMGKWTTATIKHFERMQWKLLAPFLSKHFNGDPERYDFEDGIILPFERREHKRTGEHADIYKVRIHEKHHNFNSDGIHRKFFAVKTLFGKQDFSNEVGMLKRLKNSQYIVELFATYTHRGHFHLILPWAECDLETYWKEKKTTHDLKTVIWVAQQCQGIAGGLKDVHYHLTNTSSSVLNALGELRKRSTALGPEDKNTNQPKIHPLHVVFGRHGDIKPANLLWFPDPTESGGKGAIKISDFGTGEFSWKESSPASSNSVPFTPPYRPPECDLPDSEITNMYDIWTLACLYLEFVIWYVGGWKMLEDFRKQRARCHEGFCRSNAFFMYETTQCGKGTEAESPRVVVKPAVLEFMHQIEADPACSQFIHSFMDLIRGSMLLVDPERRHSCKQIFNALGDEVEKCEEGRAYALENIAKASNAIA